MKKKWIVLAGVVLALGVLVSAAVAHRGERMRSGHGMRGMMQRLDLTEEQQEQLKDLRKEHRQEITRRTSDKGWQHDFRWQARGSHEPDGESTQ